MSKTNLLPGGARHRGGLQAVALVAFSFWGAQAVAQTGAPAATANAAAGQAPSISSGTMTAPPPTDQTYQGSVPQGTASTTPIALTLGDALNRGLKANLGLLTSEQSSREIRAERLRALSALLPTVSGQVSMTEQQLNLQALGFLFKFPPSLGFSIPSIVGPYSYQAALANATEIGRASCRERV